MPRASTEMTPVAYKVAPAAISDLGRAGNAGLYPYTRRDRRAARTGLPDVPTMDELGFRASDTPPRWSMWAPAGAPAEIAAKLERWLNQVVDMPATRAFLEPQGASAVKGSAAFLKQRLAEAITSWNNVAEVAKIGPQQ